MSSHPDLWYIRYPDGRVLRAEGVGVIRRQLAAGRLPPGTHLRRSGEGEWRGIDRFSEFAGLSLSTGGNQGGEEQTASIASRLDPVRLRMPDVRALLEELLAAVAGTLVAKKLYAAGMAGMALGALLVAASRAPFGVRIEAPGWGWLLVVAAVVVLAWLTGLLTRMSYVELSRLRPADYRDGMQGRGLTVRLTLFYLAAALLFGGVIAGLRIGPGWLQARTDESDVVLTMLAHASIPLAVTAEAFVWPLSLLLLPFAALVVIEEVSFRRGLGQWLRLVRGQFHRLLLAEGLAVVFAALLAVPLLLVLGLLATRGDGAPAQAELLAATRTFLLGVAAAVPLAYLLVANVFIYLKLRYETPGRREGTA